MMYGLLLAICIVVIIILVYYRYTVKVYRFYRPSCGYCQAMKDDWTLFKKNMWFRPVRVIDIDTTESGPWESLMQDNYHVKTVPHIVLVYPDGIRVKYDGTRSAEDMTNFVNTHIGW